MVDTLIRQKINGEEEIWYSDEYLKRQIEMAYRAGIHKGITVEFHALQPIDGRAVENLTSAFYDKIWETFQKAYDNNEVWRVAGKDYNNESNIFR